MKKEFLLGVIGLAIVLLFVAGCAPVQEVFVCPDGSRVTDPDNCGPAEEAEEEEPEVIEPGPEEQEEEEAAEEEAEEEEKIDLDISEEAQELFDKSAKADFIQYTYVISTKTLPDNIITASRDEIKIDLANKVRFSKDEAFDTIYFDLQEKTAVAYCEDRYICSTRDKPFDVEFDEYFVETPFHWLSKIDGAELTGRSQTVEKRIGVEVTFEINGKLGSMFVDNFFGIPLEITFDGDEYEFRDMIINIVRQKDLEHQFEE